MEPATDEVLVDAPMRFRIYKSGRIERLNQSVLPPDHDESTGVTSKDVVLDAGTGLSVRVYLPKLHEPSRKLPVVVYIHGGAFIIGSAADATYHTYVNSLAAAARVLVVSVDYRLAPEHPLPAAYEDSWAAIQLAASAQDQWIAEHGDVGRLFLSGDSAGANVVHDMLVRASGNAGPSIEGAILCHPWFGGNQPIEGEPEGGPAASAELWMYACPGAVGGADDPRFNPLAPGAPEMERLGCTRMLVCAGKEDGLYARDSAYYDAVAASAWPGTVEWLESHGENHVFFLGKPECENAKRLMDRLVAFIAGA
jgi:acetyl esterase/lipase